MERQRGWGDQARGCGWGGDMGGRWGVRTDKGVAAPVYTGDPAREGGAGTGGVRCGKCQ